MTDHPNTVSGLLDKRAELAGMLKFHKAEIRKITCDLDHLDAAIRLFDPNADTSRVKRYPTKHRAHRGQMKRFVLGQLRTAQAPLTSAQIAAAWIADRRLKADEETHVLIRKRVGACLTALKGAGVIAPLAELMGEYKAWALI
ncbi:MAG TPA: hypothetical protein VN805_14275 [Caulobacteraceae bacterium]|nr:hypothetical protein [Caulobacteraceae bacterium]